MSEMMKLIDRVIPPVPWQEGDNIPWNDPGFSERMLREHLSQEHDLASRKTEKIETHVRWIFEHQLAGKPGRVLDLACGPGLYTEALAEHGCSCMGVDFSPASIRHATENAAGRKLSCTYRLADVRDGGFGDGYDLAMMVYGQINVFEPAKARAILRELARSIKPGGIVLIEAQKYEHVHGGGTQTSSWYTAKEGLFSDDPHLVLQEGYWDEATCTRTERFFVFNVSTGKVERYVLPTVAYKEKVLRNMMSDAGLDNIRAFPSLCGDFDPENPFFHVLLGRAGRS